MAGYFGARDVLTGTLFNAHILDLTHGTCNLRKARSLHFQMSTVVMCCSEERLGELSSCLKAQYLVAE